MKQTICFLLAIALIAPTVNAVSAFNARYLIQHSAGDAHKITITDAIPQHSFVTMGGQMIGAFNQNNSRSYYAHRSPARYETNNDGTSVETNCGSNTCWPSTSCYLTDEYVTGSSDLNGVDMLNKTMTLKYTAWWQNNDPGLTPSVSVTHFIEHVDKNGNATTIKTSGGSITQTQTTYTKTFDINQHWDINETLRTKVRFNFSCPPIEGPMGGEGEGGEGFAPQTSDPIQIILTTIYNYFKITNPLTIKNI